MPPEGGGEDAKKNDIERLFDAIMEEAEERGLSPARPKVAGDATGLESRHISQYYAMRSGKRHMRSRWPKLSALCECETHLFVAAGVSLGPQRDTAEAKGLIRDAAKRRAMSHILLDAEYDTEGIHAVIREEAKARSVIPPKSGRPTLRWPKTKYRRLMRKSFPRKVYGQRWQIESAFSRCKRLLGSALRATSWSGQVREIFLRILTHNLMILKCHYLAFLQSKNRSLSVL